MKKNQHTDNILVVFNVLNAFEFGIPTESVANRALGTHITCNKAIEQHSQSNQTNETNEITS